VGTYIQNSIVKAPFPKLRSADSFITTAESTPLKYPDDPEKILVVVLVIAPPTAVVVFGVGELSVKTVPLFAPFICISSES
jgi:hypothetical protein